MFLHLGGDTVVNAEDIIAIMDMETTSVSKITREYLTYAEKNNDIINVSFFDLPKSYVVVKSGIGGKREKFIYLPYPLLHFIREQTDNNIKLVTDDSSQ